MENRTFLLFLPVLLLFLLPGCRIEIRDSFDDLVLESTPATRNQVLPKDSFPSILLSPEVDHNSVEGVLSISSGDEPVSGSHRWKGDRLTFIPNNAFLPGSLYCLNLTGNLSDSEGRLFPIDASIPFFSERSEAPCFEISDISPPSGSTLTDRDAELSFSFSRPVLKESLEEALFISPKEEVDISWNGEADTCTIVPRFGWDDKTSYTVSFFQSELTSSEGLFLPTSGEFTFRTDLALGQETAARITIVEFDFQRGFPPVDPQTEEMDPSDTIQIEFSRPVNRDSVEAAFIIAPYCSGSLFWKDPATAVFIPEREFQANTVYLVESSEVIPLPSGENTFTIPPVLPEVLSVWGDSDDHFPEILDPLPTDAITISPSGASGTYSFFFTYHKEIPDPVHQQKLQHRCGIATLFPPDIPPPALVGFMWSGPDSLIVQANGIGSMHQNRSCFYTLTLPDGGDQTRTLTLRFCP